MGKSIIFKAEPDAEGWETRTLQPSQSLIVNLLYCLVSGSL
jgi:hypothetical protein